MNCSDVERKYVIVDPSRNSWGRACFWAPDRRGYTLDLNKAGRYTEDEAVEITARVDDFAVFERDAELFAVATVLQDKAVGLKVFFKASKEEERPISENAVAILRSALIEGRRTLEVFAQGLASAASIDISANRVLGPEMRRALLTLSKNDCDAYLEALESLRNSAGALKDLFDEVRGHDREEADSC